MNHRNRSLRWIGSLPVFLALFFLIVPSVSAWFQQQDAVITLDREVSPNSVSMGESAPAPEVTVNLTLNSFSKPCEAVSKGKPADIVLLVDHSSSMSDIASILLGSPSKLDAMKNAAKTFTQKVDLSVNRIALTEFDDGADTVVSLSSDKNMLSQAIDSVNTGGGTAIDAGIYLAISELDMNKNQNSFGIIILLSDGDSAESPALTAANVAKTKGYRLITIALGADANTNLLSNLASQPSDYYNAPDSTELEKIYTGIAQTVIQPGAASNVKITHLVDTTNFEVIPESITPKGSFSGNTITWTVSDLTDGKLLFSYRAKPRSPGTSNIDLGDKIDYLRCQDNAKPESVEAISGLPVTVTLLPTETPSPTPTATATPTITPLPTSQPVVLPPSRAQPGIAGFFCGSGLPWWLWLIIGILLLLTLWYIYRRYRAEMAIPRAKRISPCLCNLIPLWMLPLLVILLGFILNALLGHFCRLGQSVYFWRINNSKAGVYVTSADGYIDARAYTPVNKESQCVGCHTISSTSHQIAAITGGGVGPVVVYGLDGKKVQIPAVNASYVSFSPDGTKLAVSDGNSDIQIVDIASGSMTPLAGASAPNYVEMMPFWGPNGVIAFTRSSAGATPYRIDQPCDIYTVPEGGGTATPLTGASGKGFSYYPSYSPDGKWISFTHHENGSTTYSDSFAEIYVMPAAGGTPIRLEANDGSNGEKLYGVSNSWTSWSLDSKQLAFSSKRSDSNYDILVTDITDDGHSGSAYSLTKASLPGVFEHLPYWGEAPNTSIFDELLPLLPCLIPFLLVLLAWLICRWLCKRPIPIPEIPPAPPAPDKLPPFDMIVPWQVAPALVIGVGGTGRWVLTHLKKALLDGGNGKLPDKVNLVLIDTAQEETLNLYKGKTGEPIISFAGVSLDEKEMFLLDRNLESVISALVQDPQSFPELAGWLPYSRYTGLGSQADLMRGTHGRRPLARAGLVLGVQDEFNAGTQANAQRLWNLLMEKSSAVMDNQRVQVILVGSLAGGMSGVLIDLAYLVHVAGMKNGAAGVNTEGYFTTDRAFMSGADSSQQMKVNTWASLRELSRFQLSDGWPYPMKYGKADLPINNTLRWRLLDDIYLFGGSGSRDLSDGKSADPWATVMASMSDLIGFRLDKGVISGWGQVRGEKISSEILQQQASLNEVVFSSLGSYVYRLPMQDILQEVKYHWLVELLRTGLGIDSSADTQTVNSLAAMDANGFFDGTGYGPGPEAFEVVGKLSGKGSGGQLLTDDISRFNQAVANNSRRNFNDYLTFATRLILLGRPRQNTNQLQAAFNVRLNEALAFLEECKARLDAARREAERHNQTNTRPNQAFSSQSLARIETWSQQVEKVSQSLTAQKNLLSTDLNKKLPNGKDSIYMQIRLNYERARLHKEQMEKVAVRKYLWDVAKDPSRPITAPDNRVSLADLWYEKYYSQQIAENSKRLYWTTNQGEVHLSLIAFSDRTIVLSESTVDDFMNELVRLADYYVKDVWSETSLAAVLQQHLEVRQNPEAESAAANQMWTIAAPHLSSSYNSSKKAAAFAPHPTIKTELKNLVEVLSDPMTKIESAHSPAECTLVQCTDPFVLPLVRSCDIIPASQSNELDMARNIYEATFGIEPTHTQPSEETAVFQAEHMATEYELRMAELGVQRESMNPYLVIALENDPLTRDYLLAWVKGWVTVQGEIVSLCIPGSTPVILNRKEDGPSIPRVALGLLKYSQTTDTALIERLHSALMKQTSEPDVAVLRQYYAKWAEYHQMPEEFQDQPFAVKQMATLAALVVMDYLLTLPQPSEPAAPPVKPEPPAQDFYVCANPECAERGKQTDPGFCGECGEETVAVNGKLHGKLVCLTPDCPDFGKPSMDDFCGECGNPITRLS